METLGWTRTGRRGICIRLPCEGLPPIPQPVVDTAGAQAALDAKPRLGRCRFALHVSLPPELRHDDREAAGHVIVFDRRTSRGGDSRVEKALAGFRVDVWGIYGSQDVRENLHGLPEHSKKLVWTV